MLARFSSIARQECRLRPDQPIVVGVSGGADSLCLFDLLHRAGFPLQVVYFHHHLRAQADEEARYVADLAKAWGVSFCLGEGDVRRWADQHSLSLEAAARHLRYRFLFQQAEALHAQAVAVGHHAEDQVETVLFHLVRGAGLAGLRGMPMVQLPNPWSATIPLVRPLLRFWRPEILAYCQEQSLAPREDHTNLDVTYTRNRIRYGLIPYLESYNPRIKEALWRLSQIVQGEAQAIEQWADSAWETCRVRQEAQALALDAAAVRNLPVGVQRQVLRRAVACLRGGLEDVDYALIERAIQAFQQPPATRQLDLGLGLRLVWEEGVVWLAGWEADLPNSEFPQIPAEAGQGFPVSAPGKVELGADWRLGVEVVAGETAWEAAPENRDPYQAWLDADSVPPPLWVRARRPGDRFRPLGMEGHSQKLADFMINVRLPRRARARWPLVCAEDEVIWVPGYAISHIARLRPGTRRAFHLRLSRELHAVEGES